MSWKIALAGAGILGAGLVKMQQHMSSADPFAAYWCRTPGSEGALVKSGGEWLILGHCWGCYAAAAGAAMMAFSAWQAFSARRRGAAIRLPGR